MLPSLGLADGRDDDVAGADDGSRRLAVAPLQQVDRAGEMNRYHVLVQLHQRIDVVEPDLQLKHKEMADSLFAFLRATFYRWVSLWQEVCPDLTEAPQVLAVGGLQVETFGTWRDTEGRLVWGVDDFDEVAQMPYAIDLIRLVTSAILAKRENALTLDESDAATAVLDGYSESLQAGGNPFILEESHPGLREAPDYPEQPEPLRSRRGMYG